MKATELYERDFFEWTQCNAALLRSGRFDKADIEHIAEEIEDMGKRERRELGSRLEVLLQHLLKWQAQPGRTRSWRNTIKLQRDEIAELFEEMPSLKSAWGAKLGRVYWRAVLAASAETGLPESSFPASCPFTLDQILDENFLPE
jgi:hypothetical protein